MRRLIQRLKDLGIFVEYRLGEYTGERYRVWGEDGLPHNMSAGTARVYADKMEARMWGFET